MIISDLSRRQFLTGLGALGAGALLSKSDLLAQGPGGTVRRIDVHHHFGSPEWIAMTKAKQTQGWQTWQPYTPAKAVESMDMGETQLACISITTPGIWFGNIDETRRLARQQNEYGARMVSDHKGRFALMAVLPLPEMPEASRVVRWPRSMPQYEVGHVERVAAIHEALPACIVVVGNAYGGVGVADAVRSANEAAERVRVHLLGDPIGTERV